MVSSSRKPILSEVIFNQLGGEDFITVTGSQDFIHTRRGLIFRVVSEGPNRAINGASHVQINLGKNDTYNIGFYKFSSQHDSVRKISEIECVTCDRIYSTVMEETGLPPVVDIP